MIGAFHAEIWRETHSGFAPTAVLERLDAPHRIHTWCHYLNTLQAKLHSIIALDENTMAGLIHFGPASHPEFAGSGEIKHLYVATAQQGQGVGRRLMGTAFKQMHSDGFTGAILAVLAENQAALQFYHALNGQTVCRIVDKGPIWKSENLLIKWSNLDPAFKAA